jgi:predicted ATP-grasp superfamily ATP-dependent carboligase
MRVLILDGNENQAVAAVRSLGRAEYHVAVGSSGGWSKAGWSRFARESFTYTAPQRDSARFVEDIAREVSLSREGALVLPMTERTTLPLSLYREKIFAAGGRLVLPPHETLLRAFDKEQTTALAASLGIKVPRTVLIESPASAERAARELNYPIVLKPRASEEVTPDGKVAATGGPLYARDRREMLEAFIRMRERSCSMLAQEFVEGVGAGYFALMREGELKMEFAHRRIRDVRPTGSGSAVRESVIPDPRVRDAGLKILRALGWHGVAMVEFRVRADGTPVFLEVNGRFWHSLSLAVYAGADFPLMLARMADGSDITLASDYRVGVRCRWLLGDFRHLVEVMRGAPPAFTGSFPTRARTLASFIFPVRGTYHDNFAMSDPLPEIGDWLDFMTRRLAASKV